MNTIISTESAIKNYNSKRDKIIPDIHNGISGITGYDY